MPGPLIEVPPVNLLTKGSPNKTVIGSLIATTQQKVLPEKLYSALSKMEEDLNKVYESLFDGPLPAVDGFNLTRLNAAVLNGPIPDSYNLAYTDRVNEFSRGQFLVEDDEEEPFWQFGFGNLVTDPTTDPSSYFRVGALTDGEFYISQNLHWDSGWDRDSSGGASLLQFIDGDLSLSYWDTGISDLRLSFLFQEKEIFVENLAQTDLLSFFFIGGADVMQLARDHSLAGIPAGWVALPSAAGVNLPASGNVDCDGIITINRTNARIVWYANGLRYQVAGVAF